MYKRWLPGVTAAVALAGCGSSQVTNLQPTAQPVALQTITAVAKPKAKHVRAAQVHKRTAPASTPTPAVQAQPQAAVVAPPTTSTPTPSPSTATATAPSQPAVAPHKHKKKSTGTSAGGTGLNSQGY